MCVSRHYATIQDADSFSVSNHVRRTRRLGRLHHAFHFSSHPALRVFGILNIQTELHLSGEHTDSFRGLTLDVAHKRDCSVDEIEFICTNTM